MSAFLFPLSTKGLDRWLLHQALKVKNKGGLTFPAKCLDWLIFLDTIMLASSVDQFKKATNPPGKRGLSTTAIT